MIEPLDLLIYETNNDKQIEDKINELIEEYNRDKQMLLEMIDTIQTVLRGLQK